MNRFGKLLLALLVLGAIAFGSMVRFRPSADAPAASPAVVPVARPAALTVPVAGVEPAALSNTFGDARGGRAHGALDIMAPRGAPVVAAMAGVVEKLFESKAGGLTAYVRSADRRWITYYAHLDGYAAGLREGLHVAQGSPIGRVGFTGNANPAGPHLHFEVKRMAPGDPWYRGRAVNPFPLLAGR